MKSILQTLGVMWLLSLVTLSSKLSAQEKPAAYHWEPKPNQTAVSNLATIDDQPQTQNDFTWTWNVTASNGTYSSDYYLYCSRKLVSGDCDCSNVFNITFKRARNLQIEQKRTIL